MKLLIDENISWRLKRLLHDWDVLPADEIPTMQKLTDLSIWRYAKENDYLIVTFDEDFVETQNLYGYPPKIIWLRMGNVSTQEIADKLIQLRPTLEIFEKEEQSGVMEIY